MGKAVGNLAIDGSNTGYDTVVFAENCEFSTDCNLTGLNNNVLVKGASGSGKTFSYVEANILRAFYRNLMLVIRKPKMIRKYAPMLRKRGYHVDVLNFCDPSQSTVAFDMLHYVRSYQDVLYLARSIVMANPQKKGDTKADPYWDEAAIALIAALILYTLLTKQVCCFADVIDLYKSMKVDYSSSIITTSLDGEFAKLERLAPGNQACANWKVFRELPPRTAACVMGTLGATLGHLFDPKLMEMMRMSNKLDFRKFSRRKSVLFIVVSAANPAMDFVIGNFYATALKELYETAQEQEDGKLPIPVHIMTDDACSGACIANLPEMISIIREAQISISVVCQSNSQLSAVYGESNAITIANCCDTHVYTGSMDLSSAREISTRLDIPVSDVLSFPLGSFAVFRRGSKPVLARRYQILEDKAYQEVTSDFEKKERRRKKGDGHPTSTYAQHRSTEISYIAPKQTDTAQTKGEDSLETEIYRRFDELFGALDDD